MKSDGGKVKEFVSGVDYPEWMTEVGLATLKDGYLQEGENVFEMWRRVAKTSARYLGRDSLADKFFDYMSKGWLGLATPVAANSGTNRGLPISCFGLTTPDSVDGIFKSVHEMGMMSKHGGGVGIGLTRVRGRGALIKEGKNGSSEGVIPWSKCFDSATIATSQGSVRRGATSLNLSVDHVDFSEFLRIRRPVGDINRQCLNVHQCAVISDDFMKRVESGDKDARETWIEILKTRLETGEPYMMFEDTVNRANPQGYVDQGLKVEMTNICSEIVLHTDDDHSFVCCLSSLNLAKYDEWKDTDLVETSIWFLEGVLSEFIDRASGIPGFERSIRSAIKGRALGLGVLGWHTLLQEKGIAFDSFDAMMLNAEVFRNIQSRSIKASEEMSLVYGEPDWCLGTGRRNTHLNAVAPTRSNSIICGGVSFGVEPIPGNAYADKTAKGTFIVKNPVLQRHLQRVGRDTPEVWQSIIVNDGSVQHLDFLTVQEKVVYLTAREINQLAIVRQAGQRQKFIDQSQSINLFFPENVDPKWFHKVHFEAWKMGVKTLYYCRSNSVLKSDVASRQKQDEPKQEECVACHA